VGLEKYSRFLSHDITSFYDGGNDAPEAQFDALYQLATGEGNSPYVAPSNPGWKNSLKKAAIPITDGDYHTETNYPGHTYAQALSALASMNIIVMGINLEGRSTNLVNIVNDTTAKSTRFPSTGPASA
jgi:hypothetical protein